MGAMSGGRRSAKGGRRWITAALALVALALNVLIPQGFMPAAGGGAGSPIVICTGHGPLVVAPEGPAKAPHPGGDAGHGSVCAFAGHAGPPLAPPMSAGPAVWLDAQGPAPVLAVADLAPGRGLAAPPPPARGPPGRLI